MRTIVSLIMLYLVHRVLLHAWEPYRALMRRFDRRVTWINIILVSYLAITFLIRLLQYLNQEE